MAGAISGAADGLASAVELMGVTVILLLVGLYLSGKYHTPLWVVLLPSLGLLGTGVKYYYAFKEMTRDQGPHIRKTAPRPSGLDGLLGGDLAIPEEIAESARRFDDSGKRNS